MDEMQLIRDLGSDTPLATAEELAPARARLLTARTPRRTKRFAVYGGAVIGMAAAILAAVTLIPPEQNTSANADPIQVLAGASRAALSQPGTAPRPDQFLYTKSQEPGGQFREDWHSMDGTHDGLYIAPGHIVNGKQQQQRKMLSPGCRGGRQAVIKGDKVIAGQTDPCEPFPAYLPDLPKDVDGMVAYLKRTSGEEINSIGKDVGTMLQSSYMAPESRSALFGAVGRIPGLRAVTGAKDAAGRTGIRIEWDFSGIPSGFIVDASTYAYLGDETTAQLDYAIVDKVEQRP
nr:CU044_5270 family protein [Kibdelosporangium sp. MJ126-NF4]CEL17262.1 hypothetical protein [Kibdelosporangium sp. MJ126-NF4]CTQ91508.1 hypothetical protein [Kibdelosporangium sp. MJ126-NF4]